MPAVRKVRYQAVEGGHQKDMKPQPSPVIVPHQAQGDAEIGGSVQYHQTEVRGPRHDTPPDHMKQGSSADKDNKNKGNAYLSGDGAYMSVKFTIPDAERNQRAEQRQKSKPAPVTEGGQDQDTEVDDDDIGQ